MGEVLGSLIPCFTSLHSFPRLGHEQRLCLMYLPELCADCCNVVALRYKLFSGFASISKNSEMSFLVVIIRTQPLFLLGIANQSGNCCKNQIIHSIGFACLLFQAVIDLQGSHVQ